METPKYIENALISGVELGNKHTDGRGFVLTYTFKGRGWQQCYSLAVGLDALVLLAEIMGGELVKGIVGKPVRIARNTFNGPIVAIGDLIEDRWFQT